MRAFVCVHVCVCVCVYVHMTFDIARVHETHDTIGVSIDVRLRDVTEEGRRRCVCTCVCMHMGWQLQ